MAAIDHEVEFGMLPMHLAPHTLSIHACYLINLMSHNYRVKNNIWYHVVSDICDVTYDTGMQQSEK